MANDMVRQIGWWLTVVLLAAGGAWLLLADPPARSTSQPAASPAPVATVTDPALEPLGTPVARAAPRDRAAAQPPSRPSLEGSTTTTRAPAPAPVPDIDDPPWSSPDDDPPWSSPDDNPAWVDQGWAPSDQTGGAPAEIEPEQAASTAEPGLDEARRQLGQAFPRHLPEDTPGGDEAVDAAHQVLEADLVAAGIGDLDQIRASLVLTPAPSPSAGTDLDDLDSLQVALQIRIRTQMEILEFRTYVVTLTRAPQGWAGTSIDLV